MQDRKTPVIYIPRATEPGKAGNGITLWENDKKGKEAAPDFTGHLEIEGVKMFVSAWLRMNATKGSPFLSFVESGKKLEGGGFERGANLGTANAVNFEKGQPFPADRTPYVLGEFKLGEKSHILRGYIAKSAVDAMERLGFNEAVRTNFLAKVAPQSSARQQQTPATAAASAPAPRP
jgi:hypothetical protein